MTAETFKEMIMIEFSHHTNNGYYSFYINIDNHSPIEWAFLDYEWNRKRAFVFGDDDGSIVGWVSFTPSQIKVVDIGTIETTIYVD